MQQHHLEKGRQISEDNTSSNKGYSRHISPPDIVPAFQLTLEVSRGHSLGQKHQDGWTSRIPTQPPDIPVALACLLDHLPQAELTLTGSTGYKIQVMGNKAGKNPQHRDWSIPLLSSPTLYFLPWKPRLEKRVSVEYVFTINKSVQVALFHPKCFHNQK